MESNQISDCENQSKKTLEQRKSQAETKYMKEWKNHLTSQAEKAYCPEHRTYEKTEFIIMGFGQKVLARRCITQEGMFDLIPIEEGF